MDAVGVKSHIDDDDDDDDDDVWMRIAPVISVKLTDELGDDVSAKSVIQSTDQTPTVIRCLVVGGFPPPTITVAFDRRDVTTNFRFRSRANVTGSRGLRLIEYHSERWTSEWRPTRADNGRRVQCLASVSGLASTSADARLNVLCELSPVSIQTQRT